MSQYRRPNRASPKVEAELAADRFRRCGTPSQRPCMSCGRSFKSEGRHNRLCASCRKRVAEVSPYAA